MTAGIGVLAFTFAAGGHGLPWMWRTLRVARDPAPRVATAVRLAAERLQVPVPRALELDVGQANAFALPSKRVVAVTTGAAEELDDEELAAVCAHEMGHLAESRAVRLGRLAGAHALLPLAFLRPAAAALEWPLLVALLALLGVTLLLLLPVRRMVRREERRADAVGHEHQGGEGVYVRALTKLHRAAGLPAVLSKVATGARRPRVSSEGTHGSLATRAADLGEATAVAAAAPPSRARLRGAVLAGVAVALTSFIVPRHLARAGSYVVLGPLEDQRARSSARQALAALALGGDETWLARLAAHRCAQGRAAEAVVLLRAAAAIDRVPLTLLWLAEAQAAAGRFEPARDTLFEAQRFLRERRANDWLESLLRETLQRVRIQAGAQDR